MVPTDLRNLSAENIPSHGGAVETDEGVNVKTIRRGTDLELCRPPGGATVKSIRVEIQHGRSIHPVPFLSREDGDDTRVESTAPMLFELGSLDVDDGSWDGVGCGVESCSFPRRKLGGDEVFQVLGVLGGDVGGGLGEVHL